MSTPITPDGPAVRQSDDVPTEIVALRHPGRRLAAVVIVVIAASLGFSAVANDNFQWSVVAHYMFAPQILDGLRTTLILTVVSMALSIALGVVLAVGRMSENQVITSITSLYLWFFRGTPLLVQLIFWYNLSALYPQLSLGVPFGGPVLVDATTNSLLPLWGVALVALTLNEAAYMAEIVRGGLLAVPKQQVEAADALGMSRRLTFKRVVLPQALRVIIPPTGNQVIGMLKYTSLVSVIALSDLLYSAQLIYAQTFETIPLLVVVSIWYLACTSVLSYIQGHVERHYARGYEDRGDGAGWLRTLRALTARLSRVGRLAHLPTSR